MASRQHDLVASGPWRLLGRDRAGLQLGIEVGAGGAHQAVLQRDELAFERA